jgi:hypothetical protein
MGKARMTRFSQFCKSYSSTLTMYRVVLTSGAGFITLLDEWFLTIDGIDEAISDKFDELDDEIYGWINED